jgi:hypothetical protein
MTLNMQFVEEILGKVAEVTKEVVAGRETSQKFMEVWKHVTQQA